MGAMAFLALGEGQRGGGGGWLEGGFPSIFFTQASRGFYFLTLNSFLLCRECV